jgi:hypothetical protein
VSALERVTNTDVKFRDGVEVVGCGSGKRNEEAVEGEYGVGMDRGSEFLSLALLNLRPRGAQSVIVIERHLDGLIKRDPGLGLAQCFAQSKRDDANEQSSAFQRLDPNCSKNGI